MLKRRLQWLTVYLSIILLLMSLVPVYPFAASAKGKEIKEVLSDLSAEERKAIHELEANQGFTIHPDINVETSEPVQVIVEFKQDPAKVEVAKAKAMKSRSKVTLTQASDKVEASHKQFKESLQKMKKTKAANEPAITYEYRHAINGVAMTLPGNKVKDLIQTGVVKRVWKDETVNLDLPIIDQNKIEPKMADSVPQIGVDQLHEEGIKGEGIQVGVIDTGIDYNHPDLTNAYDGYRFTVGEDPADIDPDQVKGWDYVDNDADPMETTYEDWQKSGEAEFINGISYYTSHGTHVSGTIAGTKSNDVDYAVKGVAPQVDLYNYRVLGPYGSGSTNGVIAGIDKAVKDEMDVINLSLGSGTNDPLSPTSVAVNNAVLSDVVTVVAAGNAGPGEKTVGSPGAAALPISVGASDVSQAIPTFDATAGDIVLTDLQLLAKNFTDDLEALRGQSLSVVDAGLGYAEDFSKINVEGKIALIERGEITFDEKVKNAKDAGAEAVIVFNHEEGQIPYYIGESTAYLPAFRLSNRDGQALKEALSEDLLLVFGELTNTNSEGDHLADFSSRGPAAQNYDIKPDVVAPGVAIFSTYPSYVNDPESNNYDLAYARIQGTSMASPHVAASAALILQTHPDYSPFEVKAALMNTSVDLKEDYSVYEVGAGRINAYDAVHAKTAIKVLDQTEMIDGEESIMIDEVTGSIGYGSYYLEKGQGLEKKKALRIENRSTEEKTYAVNVEFLKGDNEGIAVNIPESLTIGAEQSGNIDATIEVPDNASYGTFEGYIHIENEQSEEAFQVPFAIRVTDKGIDYVDLDREAVPNEWTFHPFLIPFINMALKIKSPMETMDVIVKDGETNEPIGLVGTLDSSNMDVDREYYILQAFMGTVFPFTNDPENPIAKERMKLPEDDYILEVIGHDENGETYTVQNVTVVDNTPPEITFNDLEPGVHEVDESMYTDEDGYHALWVHTNVYDSTIDVLNSKGLEYDQSENIVAYYQNSPFPGKIPVEANGDMKFGLLPEELENGPVNLELLPVDLATNANFMNKTRYTFVEDGTAYGITNYDEEEIRKGDTFTVTLSLKNVQALMSGEFEVEYANDLYSFENVQVNEAFAEHANENGWSVELDEPTFREDYWTDFVKVGASVEGNGFSGIDGDMKFLDVTFKLTDDHYYSGLASLSVADFSYKQAGETEQTIIPVFSHDKYTIIPKHSTITGFIKPEAFLHEDGFLLRKDYNEIGVKVYAKSQNGKKYTGTITEQGSFTIKGLPVTEEKYKVYVDVPGHLNNVLEAEVGIEKNGELIGQSKRVYPEMNLAGDSNGDKVVDIHDVMRVVAHYGKENDKADVNKDGVVDEADIRFIEKNFLEIGFDAPGNKRPLEKLGNKGLNDFLKSLGLEPNK
ncbi:S8 family serine peptidase [Virgibacillus salarius]|uniref:S8 family serine peptidase n=1 Tax=Virgibacillus salarius TaxID=447199 RepID=UPI0031D9F02D